MRRIMCVSCGKAVIIDSCTGQSCRDMSCPDCGGRIVRDHSAGALSATGNQTAAAGNPNNSFICKNGSGRSGCGTQQNRGLNSGLKTNQDRRGNGCGRRAV